MATRLLASELIVACHRAW